MVVMEGQELGFGFLPPTGTAMTNPAAPAIHPCTLADAERLALVGQATFLETFAGILDGSDVLHHCATQHAPALYREWLAQPTTRAWLATVAPGRAPVGYLLMMPSRLPVAAPRADDLEIKRIYLLQRFRGGGTGRQLVEQALTEARRLGSRRVLLGVYAGNAAAQAFYARLGFVPAGRRSFRVGDREYDDHILALDLDGSEGTG